MMYVADVPDTPNDWFDISSCGANDQAAEKLVDAVETTLLDESDKPALDKIILIKKPAHVLSPYSLVAKRRSTSEIQRSTSVDSTLDFLDASIESTAEPTKLA